MFNNTRTHLSVLYAYPTASWRHRTKAEVWQDGIQPPSNFLFILASLIPSMAKTSRAKHLCKHGQMLPIFFLFMGRAEKERERWREQSAIVRQEERKNSGPSSSSSPSLTFLSRSLPYFSLCLSVPTYAERRRILRSSSPPMPPPPQCNI